MINPYSSSRRQFFKNSAAMVAVSLAGCEQKRQVFPGQATEWSGFHPVATLYTPGLKLEVSACGGLRIFADAGRFLLASQFSIPGRQIGWNRFAVSPPTSWVVRVISQGTDSVVISGRCELYELQRTLRILDGRIKISDQIKNNGDQYIGIILRHDMLSELTVQDAFFCGANERSLIGVSKSTIKQQLRAVGALPEYTVSNVPENPTACLMTDRNFIGIVAEDTFSRLNFEAGEIDGGVFWGNRHFSLGPKATRELCWSVYAFGVEGNIFKFVNRVRGDWLENFEIIGPWTFFDVSRHVSLISNERELKGYVKQNYASIIAFKPWIDYDNFNWVTKARTRRQDYVGLVKAARAGFASIDRRVKCLGCIQSNLVLLPASVGSHLYRFRSEDVNGPGIYSFNRQQEEIFSKYAGQMPNVPMDSLVIDELGLRSYELYFDGPDKVPCIAVVTYPKLGNGQSDAMFERIDFAFRQAQLDGIYVDQFNLAFSAESRQRYHYGEADGTTVDIDVGTGNILRAYTDVALAGVGFRVSLVNEVLARGKFMAANTAAAEEELQGTRVMRFVEGDPALSEIPQNSLSPSRLSRSLLRAQLGSPLALGVQFPEQPAVALEEPRSLKTVSAAIEYLRHGLLYCHFYVGGTSPASGEAGPIARMYPITPIEIGPGWVAGIERVVTAKSGTFSIGCEEKPEIYYFSGDGTQTFRETSVYRSGSRWLADLKLRDWHEIAIIESRGGSSTET
jgi:hypothetical protein